MKAVLWFGIVTSLPPLALGILNAFYGMARGGRRIVEIDYSLARDKGTVKLPSQPLKSSREHTLCVLDLCAP
jgi:hypothetical protein